MEKKCIKCCEVKPLTEFPTRKLKNGIGYRGECRICKNSRTRKNYDPEKKKQYREENRELINERSRKRYEDNKEKYLKAMKKWREGNKEHMQEYRKQRWVENKEELSKINKQYREENRERIAEQSKKYREENKERLSQQRKQYREENKELLTERRKKYRKENKELINKRKREQYQQRLDNDEIFRVKETIRKTIYSKIKDHKKFRTCEILGCSYEEFKVHIEEQFTEGMTWENHGVYGWHYDHIVPIASAETEDDLYRLNNYTNFQPLWAEDNLKKSYKLNWSK